MSPRAGLTPDRIVEEATAIADRDGLAHVTLKRVAAALSVRPPSLYNHVAGLEELLRLLRLRALRELGAAIQRAAVGRTGSEAVASIGRAYRTFAREHPGLYAATVPATPVDDPEAHRVSADIVATVVAALQGFGLDDTAAIHATRSLRAAVHGFVDLELAGGFGMDVDVDASFDWLLDLVATGIGRRAGADVA